VGSSGPAHKHTQPYHVGSGTNPHHQFTAASIKQKGSTFSSIPWDIIYEVINSLFLHQSDIRYKGDKFREGRNDWGMQIP
jgi:hypothetical protein